MVFYSCSLYPIYRKRTQYLKAIANDIGLPEYKTYEELYKALEDEGTVRSIMEMIKK